MDESILQREALRVKAQNERALHHGLSATLTLEQWIQTLNHFNWQCAYCLSPYELLEHFIPIPLQGETSRFNCIPACTLCNSRKNDEHPATLTWIAPSTLLYIRSYFVSLYRGEAMEARAGESITKEARPDAIYTIHDISTRLKVSERHIRRWISEGVLSGVLIKGKWYFSEADMLAIYPSLSTPYTFSEVARRLRICERSLHRLVHSGEIEGRLIARQWRFTEAAIQAYLKKCTPTEGKGARKKRAYTRRSAS